MSFEKWDIYDASGKPTGRTIPRGRCFFKSGEYHLVVHIWVLSSDGRYLIQRRSESKKLMPGEWAATGGAAVSGEDSFSAAHRELAEELGIATDETTLKYLTRIKRRNSFVDVYATVCDTPSSELKLQKCEVSAARWVDRAELEKMIEKGEFHNYGNSYFTTVFGCVDDYMSRKAVTL